MPNQTKPATTQRAYTLRLRGVDPRDNSWRSDLWRTHEAVNKGAKAFGDWLLTLRGGLDHTLADTKVKDGKGKSDRDPTAEERKARRILLALSWLSVESKLGAPEGFIIASGTEAFEDRSGKIVVALEGILKSRNLANDEIDEWKKDCLSSLSAGIRKDAVWINRSKAFDDACGNEDKQKAREDAQTLLWFLLTNDYLMLPKKPEKTSETIGQQGEEEETDDDALAEAIVKSGKGAGQRTRHLFSHIFGRKTTQGFGKPTHTLNLRDHWHQYIKPIVEDAGIPLSDPNTKAKKNDPPSPTELHREMFSKAAARLAQIWTKQKQQELEREQRAAAHDELKKLENDQAYNTALILMDTFCRERGQSTGSHEEYRINPRAIEGWDRIVAAWEKITETDTNQATEKRIEEAKRLKEEDPDKKLGDINLFVSLAESEYEPVWRHNGQANPSILKTYVKGWKALTDAVRLKVAAFRHPDPYFHPVFCQFGVSRPSIKYSRLEGVPQDDVREVRMRLWTDRQAKDVTLLAVSNHFDKQIGSATASKANESKPIPEVTRRSRLGIAAMTGPVKTATYRVAHVFDEQEVRSRKRTDDDSAINETGNDETEDGKQKKPSWNGTLQANRRELEAIGRMESSRPVKAEQAKDHLRWWLIVSLELQQKGPWYDFIKNSPDKTAFKRTYKSGKKKGTDYVSHGQPHEKANDTRKRPARLILSRLPGLRVLSVDLGHRFAAACAVWEAVNAEQVKEACRVAGHGEPKESDLYLHLKRKETTQKKGYEVEVEKTTIYRRIGADTLPDSTPHPAPWARLDRQFLIKLQGEEEGVREASNEEVWAAHQMETAIGCSLPLIDRLVASGWGGSDKQRARLEEVKQLGWKPAEKSESVDESNAGEESEVYRPSLSVDELMSSSVRTMRLALKRHGDHARIAFAMTAGYKPMPGDRRYYFTEAKDASANEDATERNGKHIEFILDALLLWCGLRSLRGWRDDAAKQLWDGHISRLSGYKAPEEIGEDASSVEHKKKQKENRERLHDVAKALARDTNLRKTLHDVWKTRWEDDDERWKKQLRWLKDWILPRGKAANDPAIRKVGGLSLTRLATLTEFRRKVQVGFFTRFTPDGRQTERGQKGQPTDKPLTVPEHFGQRALDALEHLREQRVKQLASRIAEAALGVGSEDARHWNGGKRPDRRIDAPRFAPCHAVVIENLTHYRPDETRTRRENRQLMTWSSSKVKKYLAEACQLHGLHLREVSASYTSRQDSRTGAPGLRCQDVTVEKFMRSPFWKKQVKQAAAKQANNKGDARERFLCDLNALWKDKALADWKKAGVARVPLKGGEIFVSADSTSPAAKGLQADLNAAANIGLRALIDPDWPGKWWYVPCQPGSFLPLKDKVDGSAAVNLNQELRHPVHSQSSDAATNKKNRRLRSGGQSKDVVNLWRDISSSPLECSKCGEWKEYVVYQNEVQCRVIRVLEGQIKGRYKQTRDESREDDIPF